MELTLKREFSYYMLTIYVPTCMLVIVSWFSFWIDPKVFQKKVHRTKSINKLSNNNFFLGSASQGGPGGDHLADDVDEDRLHQQLPAPSCIHQGLNPHRRLKSEHILISKCKHDAKQYEYLAAAVSALVF